MSSIQTIYLAGGCYWGMQELFRQMYGITATKVGFTGGHVVNAAYREVSTGTTGHAETLKVEFDSEKISLSQILFEFFRIHNPTTPNQQGNDMGSQYRSAIFYCNAEKKNLAQAVINWVNQTGQWGAPIVTELTAFKGFYPAEEKHQRYLEKIPDGYTCHFRRNLDLQESLFKYHSAD